MKVLVTGASGFIGSHLMKTLYEYYPGYAVLGLTRQHNHPKYMHCDLRYEDCIRGILDRFQPDVIFHLAANPLTKYDNENPTAISKDNILGTHNLLAHAPKGCRFVFASSAAVYGNSHAGWCCDEVHDLPKPNSVYGATKLAGEGLVVAYTQMGLVNGIILRYVANVGTGATHGVLRDFVNKLRDPKQKEFELIGAAPGSSKPYIHVQDTVNATLFAAFSSGFNYVVNVATEGNINIDLLASIVMTELKIHKPKKWTGQSWLGDSMSVCVDNKRLTNILGHKLLYPTSMVAIKAAIKDIMEEKMPLEYKYESVIKDSVEQCLSEANELGKQGFRLHTFVTKGLVDGDGKVMLCWIMEKETVLT